MPIELVTWIDAESEDNKWYSYESALAYAKSPLPIVESLGFVIHENDESITLIHSLDTLNNDVGHAIKIPKGMIKNRETLARKVKPLSGKDKRVKNVEK